MTSEPPGARASGTEPLVSLCMIVKDEEGELAQALASATGLADEVVVYDTGSSDGTVALARRLGARVVEGYWDDDFSRARNAALGECSGEWVLWLDADESVTGDFTRLRERLAAEGRVDALLVSIESLEGAGLSGRLAFHATRLFRRRACRWLGALHEQVVRRADAQLPVAGMASEVRILHRGYTAASQLDRRKVERNLKIARRALDEQGGDGAARAIALVNYGRTLSASTRADEAIAPLEEAAACTDNPTIRRQALQTLVRVQVGLGRLDEALATVDELRDHSTSQVTADVLEARVRLERGELVEVLEITDRVPFLELDDDGFEGGRNLVAWMRARALRGLGRPSEAADALLEGMRTHGILDEPLSSVCDLLEQARRSPAEIADHVRPECVAVVAAAATRLEPSRADAVLSGLAQRFPERVEVLAAASVVAGELPVARALYWSARLRERGLADPCPLVRIAGRAGIEPVVRLRAAAAAYGAFAEERVVAAARAALGDLDAAGRTGALEDVAQLSPALARLLASGRRTAALRLARDARRAPGYLSCSTADGGDLVADPSALPLPDGACHLAVVPDLLCGLGDDDLDAALDELRRVLADGARLEVRVPNLEHVARQVLADGDVERALTALYGPGRFGAPDAPGRNRTAFSASTLAALLEGAGFTLESLEAGAELVARARRAELRERRCDRPAPLLSVAFVASDGDGERLAASLDSLASERAVAFELLVLANGPSARLRSVLDAVALDVSRLESEARLSFGRAANLLVRAARAELVVLAAPGVAFAPGALAALVPAFEDGDVAGGAPLVVDAEGVVRATGLELGADPDRPVLSCRPRGALARRDAEAVVAPSDVDALVPGCLALRRSALSHAGGFGARYDELDAVVDVSLRLRALGWRLRYVPSAVATAPALPTEVDASERLARRWASHPLLPRQVRAPLRRSELLPQSTLVDRVMVGSGQLRVPPPRPGGVNLVGRFDASGAASGRAQRLGEALASLGVATARLHCGDGAVRPVGGDEPLAYDTTLFCLDPAELYAFLAVVGLESLRGRYTIGTWHYPFVEPAGDCAGLAQMTNELWVPSESARRALAAVSAKPVLRMPPAIACPRLAERHRDGATFVVSAVAQLGTGSAGEIARANPTGAIEAFRAAFRRGEDAVLELRLEGDNTARALDACEAAADGDPRVRLLAEPEPAGAALERGDCFLGLQRASAFEHPIAEAMAAGVPVVAVAHGGPSEYLRSDNAEKVAFSLARTTKAHLPYPIGAPWAEPDVADAARRLRLVFDDPARARTKARRARAAIASRYAPRVAHGAIGARLAAIAAALRGEVRAAG
ncbi:MAG TPA: glycosyltransferase [Acidimicrobiales bacterium]|nr:glycosyltransferase [Acidimicrobiales bacterium]